MGTRTALELEAVLQREAELRARLAAEEEAKAEVSPPVLRLAVVLHNLICPEEHPAGCGWKNDPAADDPEGADWTEADHEWWLTITRAALGGMVRDGWTLIPPGETESLPATPEPIA